MNYLQHPNLLVQFWAATNTEFDKILDSFVKRNGWLFQDLGLVAKKANIGNIFRCVCALSNNAQAKEERLDHFLRVNYAILDAAKTQWLAPWRKFVVDPSKNVIPPFLKRQVGGFFLLYMLYSNQPLPNRFHKKQKILMDARDIIAMHVFNATLQRLPKSDDQFKELARQVVVLFNDLVKSDAFEFCAVNDTFTTPCRSVRQLLANKFCAFTKIIYSLKDLRDQLYYITHQENVKTFRSLAAYGRFLPQKTSKINSKSKGKSVSDDNAFPPAEKKWSVEEIKALESENDVGKIAHNVTCILNSLDFGPILTRNRLTGIADNLLDKEVNNCAKAYLTQKNLIEGRHSMRQQQRQAIRNAEANQRSMSVVLRKYYLGNHDWVDTLFQDDQEIPPEENMNIDDLKDTIVPEVLMAGNDDDEGDWMTEDESDGEEYDAEICRSPKKQRVESNAKSTQSPRKRNQRYFSMPTIM